MSKISEEKRELLKQQIEEFLKSNPEDYRNEDKPEIKKIINDLQVAQIELELQNDELQKTYIELEKSRTRYFKLFNNAPVGYIVVDGNGVIKLYNDTFHKMIQASKDLVGTSLSKYIYSEDAPVFLSRFKAFFKSPKNKSFELRLLHPVRKNFYVRLEAVLAESIVPESIDENTYREELLIIVSDISEQKNAEYNLFKQKEYLSTTLNSIGDAVITTDVIGIVTVINPIAENITGWNSADAVGQPLEKILVLTDSRTGERLQNPVYQVLEDLKIHEMTGHTLLTSKDSRKYHIADSAAPIIDGSGKLLGAVLVFRDISIQYQLQEELKFQSLLLENIHDLIIATDCDGIIQYVNDAECLLFEKPKEWFIGQSISTLGQNTDRSYSHEDILNHASEKGYWSGEMINRLPNGREVLLEVSIQSIISTEGVIIGYVGISSDITEKKANENKLAQLARLESLGLIAGGIAHNFKNLLTTMSFNLSLAKHKPESVHLYFEKLNSLISQASSLATRFQTFSSGGAPIKEVLNIKKLIEEVKDTVLSGTNIITKINYDNDLLNIEADPKQLHEVFTNLLINAKHAVRDYGKIEINGENVMISNHRLLFEGKFVRIDITDDGIGIPKDKLNEIFNPFYTTKPEGTGLGLATVQHIIHSHDGDILADSELGKWTKMSVFLPTTEKQPDNKIDEEYCVTTKEKKVLFLDDNEDICSNMVELGSIINVTIDVTKFAEEAVKQYEAEFRGNDPYDAVILDLTLQGSDMQGEDVLKKLKEIDPKVRAIVFSGHSTKAIVANYKDYGFVGRLDKPVSLDKLSNVINNVCR